MLAIDIGTTLAQEKLAPLMFIIPIHAPLPKYVQPEFKYLLVDSKKKHVLPNIAFFRILALKSHIFSKEHPISALTLSHPLIFLTFQHFSCFFFIIFIVL